MTSPKGVLDSYYSKLKSIQDSIVLKDDGSNTNFIVDLYVLIEQVIEKMEQQSTIDGSVSIYISSIEKIEDLIRRL